MYKYIVKNGCVVNTSTMGIGNSSKKKNLGEKKLEWRLHTQQPSIQTTIDAIELAGGIKEVARHFDISFNAVRYWVTLSEWGVPANKAIALSKLIDEKITPLQLRPDVFKGYK